VNTLVFQESTLIENAFDVFIKTPNYDARLKALKVDIGGDARVVELRRYPPSKFTLIILLK